ncbi:hypothetical protein [Verrucosispora sp. WMMD1129]|nr:hypothetical protein [Verrucosispora sp. WMMD1129]WFE45338.1 hypothetical protein O7624_13735 [Verrucosispora sp. WMMD1129]
MRRSSDGHSFYPTTVRAATVRQAVQRLVALDVLPAHILTGGAS